MKKKRLLRRLNVSSSAVPFEAGLKFFYASFISAKLHEHEVTIYKLENE